MLAPDIDNAAVLAATHGPLVFSDASLPERDRLAHALRDRRFREPIIFVCEGTGRDWSIMPGVWHVYVPNVDDADAVQRAVDGIIHPGLHQ